VADRGPVFTGGAFGILDPAIEAIVLGREHRPVRLGQDAFDQFAVLLEALKRPIVRLVAAHTHWPKIQVGELGHWRGLCLRREFEKRGLEFLRTQGTVFLRGGGIERWTAGFQLVVVAVIIISPFWPQPPV
jgi:hypothetical protein